MGMRNLALAGAFALTAVSGCKRPTSPEGAGNKPTAAEIQKQPSASTPDERTEEDMQSVLGYDSSFGHVPPYRSREMDEYGMNLLLKAEATKQRLIEALTGTVSKSEQTVEDVLGQVTKTEGWGLRCSAIADVAKEDFINAVSGVGATGLLIEQFKRDAENVCRERHKLPREPLIPSASAACDF